jgi:hypothetical protein
LDCTQDLLKLEYRYGNWSGSTLDETKNNGGMAEQKITVPAVGSTTGFIAVQAYTYDDLNRIHDAVENVTPAGGSSSQSWKQTFDIDRYGNRRFDTTGSNTTTLGSCSTAVCNPTFDTPKNRFHRRMASSMKQLC